MARRSFISSLGSSLNIKFSSHISRSSHANNVTPADATPAVVDDAPSSGVADICRGICFNPYAGEEDDAGAPGPLVPSRNENMALRCGGFCLKEPPDMLGWSDCELGSFVHDNNKYAVCLYIKTTHSLQPLLLWVWIQSWMTYAYHINTF